MDDGTGRPGLFAQGSVGRFLLGLTLGAVASSICACGLLTAIIRLGSAGFVEARSGEFSAGWDGGRTFADGRTITDCVSEVQRRGASECSSLHPRCGIAISAFTVACIRAANDDDYCASVPDASEIEASIEWTRSKCAAFSGKWCPPLMADVQSACGMRKERATTDDATNDASEPE